jgi:hypothetical protein
MNISHACIRLIRLAMKNARAGSEVFAKNFACVTQIYAKKVTFIAIVPLIAEHSNAPASMQVESATPINVKNARTIILRINVSIKVAGSKSLVKLL